MKNLIAALFLIVTTGCSTTQKTNPKDHLLKNRDFETPSKEFSKALVKDDLKVLIQFFKNGYSGYEFIDSSLIERAETRLQKLSDKSINNWESLCQEVAIIFNDLPDGHLQAYHKKNCLPKHLSSDRISNIGKNISEGYLKKAYKTVIKKRNPCIGTKTPGWSWS